MIEHPDLINFWKKGKSILTSCIAQSINVLLESFEKLCPNYAIKYLVIFKFWRKEKVYQTSTLVIFKKASQPHTSGNAVRSMNKIGVFNHLLLILILILLAPRN